MKGIKGLNKDIWGMTTGAVAIILLLNFLAVVVLFVTGTELLLEPAAGIVAAVLILFGLLAGFFAKRRGVGKLWRRLLIASIAVNFLIIAYYCAAVILILAYL